MPRSLKPQQVREYVSGETGERIPIMFDRNDLTFFAQYGADFVHDKTAAGIPAKLEALIKLAGVVDWQRCIELHRVYPPSGGASITLWHKTFEWGYRSDGKLMQRSWHRDFGTTGNAHHWSLSYTSLKTPFAPPMYLGGVDFLVYTPELDEGLRQLEEMILNVRRLVDRLVETPEGIALITQVGGGEGQFSLPAKASSHEG